MKDYKFTSVSVKDNGLRAKVEVYDASKNDSFTTDYSNMTPVHTDLNDAMQKLIFHVENILHANIPGLFVDSYYRQPTGNNELICIYCSYHVDKAPQPLSLAVRIQLGETEYEWIDKLLEDLSLCEREALLYIQKGKRYGVEGFVDLSFLEEENHKLDKAA